MSPLRDLLDRLDLDLDVVAPGVFRGPGGDEPLHRLFGGQVAAQALAAMGRTVAAERPVHSLHVQFLRPALPSLPMELRVMTVKHGRSFDVRQVSVGQPDHGSVLVASASFQCAETGPRHAGAVLPPMAAREAECLPRWEERFAGRRHRLSPLWARSRPVDLRFTDPAALDESLRERPAPDNAPCSGRTGHCPTTHCCTPASWSTPPT